MTQAAIAPGPKGNVLLMPTRAIRKKTHEYLQRLEEKYGDISKIKFGPFTVIYLANPDYIEYVFLNRDIYTKVQEGGMLRILLGNGLLTSEGDFWLKQRRLIQPVFHKQRLERFIQKISESTDEMLAGWEMQNGETLDVYNEMNRVTLDIVGKTLFSVNVKSEFDKVNSALTKIMTAIRNRSRFMRFPLWVPLPSHLRIEHNRKVLDETISEIINQRRNATFGRHRLAAGDAGKFDDLLTMLMEVEDADTRERMTDKQLRDEVLTIFIAGHETTANSLAFTLYLLAKNPEAKKLLQKEINEVFNAEEMTFEKLQKLEYTTMVIKESMRLYPPAWMIPREAAKDDLIGGYQIKKGDKVLSSPYAMQRSPRYWKNPEEFIPERFTAEKIKDMPRYAYFPFGGGARMCVGNNFAMMEMQIVLAKICKQFDCVLPENFELELLPLITLRPKEGIPLILQKREKKF
jgi:cytochrome P450